MTFKNEFHEVIQTICNALLTLKFNRKNIPN